MITIFKPGAYLLFLHYFKVSYSNHISQKSINRV